MNQRLVELAKEKGFHEEFHEELYLYQIHEWLSSNKGIHVNVFYRPHADSYNYSVVASRKAKGIKPGRECLVSRVYENIESYKKALGKGLLDALSFIIINRKS